MLLDDVVRAEASDDVGNEQWRVKITTDGLHSDLEQEQGQVGRTVIDVPIEGIDGLGIRIPKCLDVNRLWEILDECLSRAEEATSLPLALDNSPV